MTMICSECGGSAFPMTNGTEYVCLQKGAIMPLNPYLQGEVIGVGTFVTESGDEIDHDTRDPAAACPGCREGVLESFGKPEQETGWQPYGCRKCGWEG